MKILIRYILLVMESPEIKETLPKTNQPIVPVKKIKHIPLLLAVLFLVSGLSLLGLSIRRFSKRMTDLKPPVVTPFPPAPTSYSKLLSTPIIGTTSPSREPSKALVSAKQWNLKKQTSSGYKTVLTIPENTYSLVSKWQNYLFYADGPVFSYNFDTNEKKEVFNLESRKDYEEENSYITDLKIYEDTLFVTVGGYMLDGAVFWQKLPNGKIERLVTEKGGSVEFWKNRYWVWNRDGDAGSSMEEYYLLDMPTKKVTKIAEFGADNNKGEVVVGVDNQNRIIASGYSVPFVPGGEYSLNYDYVYGISLIDPKVRIGIISKQEMPKGIWGVYYLSNFDKLLLAGKQNYLFDFLNKKIARTDILEPKTTDTIYGEELSFDDAIQIIQLPSGYKFVKEY